MDKKFLKTSLGWGIALWLIGYLLGFVFFILLPPEYIGWAITPIGIAFTLWVLFKKIKTKEINYYLKLGIVWVAIAILLDYVFIVKLLAPEDGYYIPDVYLYYLLTLTLPLLVGWIKNK